MAFNQITDHAQQVLDLLIEQFKGKPNFEAMVRIFAERIQEIENVNVDICEVQTVDGAFGLNQDYLGEIIGQERLGFDDDFYRNLLRAKIGENVSKGGIEDIIQVASLLTQSSVVELQEWYSAGLGVYINNAVDAALINFFYERIDRVAVAGVRLEGLFCFDPDEAFAFEGADSDTTAGFGDLTDALDGGLFGEQHVRTEPFFSFSGDPGVTDGDLGFGTLEDVLYGGHLIGI